MSWKIPVKYKQRDVDAEVFPNTRTIKRHLKISHTEKQTRELLPRRSVVVKLKIREAKKFQPCPRHGSKYLVKEGGAVYCYAETKGEMFDRCFYHVSYKNGDECSEDEVV